MRRPIVQHIWTGLRLKVFECFFLWKETFPLLNATFLLWKLTLHNFRQKNLSVSGCAVRIDAEHSVKHSIKKNQSWKIFREENTYCTHCFGKIIAINDNLWWLFENNITKFHGPTKLYAKFWLQMLSTIFEKLPILQIWSRICSKTAHCEKKVCFTYMSTCRNVTMQK